MSRKDEAELDRANQINAELLADVLHSGGQVELADRFSSIAEELGGQAEAQSRRHEEAVGKITGGMFDRLQQHLRETPLVINYGLGEDPTPQGNILSDRIDETTDEAIQEFYELLGVGERAKNTKFRTKTILAGMGATASAHVEAGRIREDSKLARKSRDKDPTWRVRIRTIPTGLGFSIEETRFASWSRRARTAEPDLVEVDVIFDKPKRTEA